MALVPAMQPDNPPATDLREEFQRRETGCEQCKRPDERGCPVRDLKGKPRHLERPRDQRDHRAHGAEKPPDENRPYAPALEELLAALDHLRIARERPDFMRRVFELEPDPVGDPVAERSPDRRPDPDRDEGN